MLGLHILMRENTTAKNIHMIDNIEEGNIVAVELVARKLSIAHDHGHQKHGSYVCPLLSRAGVTGAVLHPSRYLLDLYGWLI